MEDGVVEGDVVLNAFPLLQVSSDSDVGGAIGFQESLDVGDDGFLLGFGDDVEDVDAEDGLVLAGLLAQVLGSPVRVVGGGSQLLGVLALAAAVVEHGFGQEPLVLQVLGGDADGGAGDGGFVRLFHAWRGI